jgi:hypothetical protein
MDPDAFDPMGAKSMHYRMIQKTHRRISHEGRGRLDDEDDEAGTGS